MKGNVVVGQMAQSIMEGTFRPFAKKGLPCKFVTYHADHFDNQTCRTGSIQ
jgi:hypothetical protein